MITTGLKRPNVISVAADLADPVTMPPHPVICCGSA
jgi:hypothetical protein